MKKVKKMAKEYIIDFPSTTDIDTILKMITSEMSIHQTVSDSCIHAATSEMISNNLREDILKTALKEKESYHNWKTLYHALVNMEDYHRPEMPR